MLPELRILLNMHIGERIKARTKEFGIGTTELARRINTTKQNVYTIFERKSIDTDLLQKLSKALEFDFFSYFGTTGNGGTNESQGPYGDSQKEIAKLKAEIEKLQTELKELREAYAISKELLKLKTKKTPKKSSRK